MTTSEMLKKHGWVRVSWRKSGMIIKAKWHDPKTGQVWSQGYAVIIQRYRNQIARLLKRRNSEVLR